MPKRNYDHMRASDLDVLRAIEDAKNVPAKIATSEYATNTTPPGFVFDGYAHHSKLRGMAARGLIRVESNWRYYDCWITPAGREKLAELEAAES